MTTKPKDRVTYFFGEKELPVIGCFQVREGYVIVIGKHAWAGFPPEHAPQPAEWFSVDTKIRFAINSLLRFHDDEPSMIFMTREDREKLEKGR